MNMQPTSRDLLRTVKAARGALDDARALIHDAQTAKRSGHENVARTLLFYARGLIMDARRVYAAAMAQLAKRKCVTHHYARSVDRFRAEIRAEHVGTLWTSPRSYGRRQSAQRAAERYLFKLRLAAY